MILSCGLVEALIKYNFTACEYKIIFTILNLIEDLNFNKYIPSQNFILTTGLGKTYISKILNGLINRNIIFRENKKIKFNINFEEWKEKEKPTIIKSVPIKKVKKIVKKKSKNKITINRENVPKKFYDFFNTYPKHRRFKFKKTLEVWMSINPDDTMADYIISQVEKFKTSINWTEDNGKWIPACYNFLSDKRWNEELKYPEEEWRKI